MRHQNNYILLSVKSLNLTGEYFDLEKIYFNPHFTMGLITIFFSNQRMHNRRKYFF